MPRKTKKKTATATFDPAAAITNDLIAIIERGTLPWRKPWKGGAAPVPLRHCGTPYQGSNAFLLTVQQMLMGYTSPYWMTMLQANEQGARIRKGERSSLVVRFGTYQGDDVDVDMDDRPHEDGRRTRRFLKSYRVFNAEQIEGLDERFHPKAQEAPAYPTSQPIPHMQDFFEAIGGNVSFTGRRACYVPAIDKIYMPEISLFENPLHFFGTWAHEYGHWTKPRHRLNRDYGQSRFGNTAYAREELTAELTSVFVGQHLGFTAHTLEMNAAYLESWLSVLRADKTAIFKHAADAQKACDYLIAASRQGKMSAPMAA